MAADRSDVEMVKLLLGATGRDGTIVNINGGDKDASTAMHYASLRLNVEVLNLLLGGGKDGTAVDINATNRLGYVQQKNKFASLNPPIFSSIEDFDRVPCPPPPARSSVASTLPRYPARQLC